MEASPAQGMDLDRRKREGTSFPPDWAPADGEIGRSWECGTVCEGPVSAGRIGPRVFAKPFFAIYKENFSSILNLLYKLIKKFFNVAK